MKLVKRMNYWDRDLENKDCYKRGVQCDMTLDLNVWENYSEVYQF